MTLADKQLEPRGEARWSICLHLPSVLTEARRGGAYSFLMDRLVGFAVFLDNFSLCFSCGQSCQYKSGVWEEGSYNKSLISC